VGDGVTDDGEEVLCEVVGGGWGADLVVDDADVLLLFGEL